MMGLVTFGIVLLLSSSSLSEVIIDDECELMQYLNIGESGVIQCSLDNFIVASWYSSNENRAILFYKENGDKSGEGFESGEYDIYPNGSLLVRNVTVDHDGVFTVTKVISTVGAITAQYDIHVKTVVKPTTSYPIIDDCADGTPSCLLSVNSDGYIRCHIDKSRPPVNLTWIAKEHGRDVIVPSSYSSFPHDNITFISQTIASYSISQLSLLNMFICQVSSIPNNLVLERESVILLNKVFDYTEAVTPSGIHVEVNVDVVLVCSGRRIGTLVWKQLLNRKESWSTILYTIPPPNHFSEYYLTGFNVDSDGSLLLRSVKTEHEGLYACIHQDDQQEDIRLYDVKVYVNPFPAYPVVDGCNHQQYCVLHVNDGDFLNCSIFGIRPEVNLEWKALQDTGKVSFEERSHSVKQTEDRFDVIVTSRVSFSPSSGNRITVECRVTGSDRHMFDLSTTMDLVFENVPVSNQPALGILLIIPIVFVVVTVAVVFLTLLLKRRATKREERLKREEDGERCPMMPGVNENNEPTSEGEKLFITQLKTKYELLYNSVLPIPYNKNKILCVDKVYVKAGIEFLTDVTRGTWETLKSYRELLTPNCLNSKRQIIEGKPGHGKSTLMLQLVYDWCNNIQSSPLSAVDIIIYLRLRQLTGVPSIATAIKRFILPKDTPLSEENINTILGKFSHILFLLDGFDEYPDQDNPESFVLHILKKELFQDADVILTSRSSCLPKKVTPTTSRVRLTGFNEESRDAYIIKVVTGENRNTPEKIKCKLFENPVLEVLCVVPLFFVTFAHVAHENKDLISFKTVTSFFTFMIECFHSHVRNKMDDENVAQFDIFENDHKVLDKIAFDSLNREKQKIVWEREELSEKLGKEFYDQYVRIGILVEEEVLEKAEESESVASCRYKWEVRFYNKLFCQWYAAHHLSNLLRNTDNDNFDEFFKYLDPYDLHYLYRFTSGIDKNASRKIIKHFQSTYEKQKFAILCMFEQKRNTEVDLEQIGHMVSTNSMSINVQDTKLLQRSTIQILDIASKNGIPISCVTLGQSFDKIEKDEIILRSGLTLPKLMTVKKMHIETDEDRELTEDDVLKICTYVLQSQRLQEISFGRCLLPLSYSPDSLFSEMIERDVAVFWSRYGYRLDFHLGLWRVANVDTIQSLCSTDVHIRNADSELRQNCTIELLKNASKYNVNATRLILDECFDSFKDRELELSSGISLSPLPCVKKILIKPTGKEEVTPEVVTGVSEYGRLCSGLTELRFHKLCKLPLSVDKAVISSDLRSWTVPVCWCPFDLDFRLDLKSGQWEVDDLDYVREFCSNEVHINFNGPIMQQRSTIQLLKIASNYDIPISFVKLSDCFPRIDESGLNLAVYPGVTVPLSSIQTLWINDKSRVSNVELEAILNYVSQFTSLKELLLDSNMLPKTGSLKAIPPSFITGNIKVLQFKEGQVKRLNLETVEWQV